MSMLILGLVLVKNIFGGVTDNVNEVNSKVKTEIGNLFSDSRKVVISLSNGIAKIKQGDQWGIAFGIKNNLNGQIFSWTVSLDDSTITQKCGGLTATKASKWIISGGTGSADIGSGQEEFGLIRVLIPEGSVSDISNCLVRFKLAVKKADGSAYQTALFDVQVVS